MSQLNSMNVATKWLKISLGQVNLVIWPDSHPEIPFGLFLMQKSHREPMTTSMSPTWALEDILRVFTSLRIKLPWRDVQPEKNFIFPCLRRSFSLWALTKWGLFFLEESPQTVFYCYRMESYRRWSGLEAFFMQIYINPSTTLEATTQCQPDNGFYPSNIEYILCLFCQKVEIGLPIGSRKE